MKSQMRLIKRALEYRPISEIGAVPPSTRGIYSLYKKRGNFYDLVYIGMSGREGRLRVRLKKHRDSKATLWTHFSFYEVWDNISDTEISELEGLFPQLYRFDRRANRLNRQVTYRNRMSTRRFKWHFIKWCSTASESLQRSDSSKGWHHCQGHCALRMLFGNTVLFTANSPVGHK